MFLVALFQLLIVASTQFSPPTHDSHHQVRVVNFTGVGLGLSDEVDVNDGEWARGLAPDADASARAEALTAYIQSKVTDDYKVSLGTGGQGAEWQGTGWQSIITRSARAQIWGSGLGNRTTRSSSAPGDAAGGVWNIFGNEQCDTNPDWLQDAYRTGYLAVGTACPLTTF